MTIPIITNYGILASISWNSTNWTDNPTIDDLKASKYDYVKDNAHMHESINFGHNKLPVEDDGYFIGYTPMFNTPPALKNSQNVDIVFFFSSYYKNENKKSIIGFYGFPIFGERYERTAIHPLYKTYDWGNIKAFPEDIIYFDNPIIINNANVQEKNLLPKGKEIGQQGFNYLNSDNVQNLVSLALALNSANKKLQSFAEKLPLQIEISKEASDLANFYKIVQKNNADSLNGINKLEQKMKNQQPEVKRRISSYIERGAIANKVKGLTGRKCLVCEALGQSAFSFLKSNGEYYIETHHVEQVSTAKKGVLGLSNLITVCANHHRQLHYGQAELIEHTDEQFTFNIDGKTIKIKKTNLI